MRCGMVGIVDQDEAVSGGRGGGTMTGSDFRWPDVDLERVHLAPFEPQSFSSGTPWTGKQGWVQFAPVVRLANDCCENASPGLLLGAEWTENDGTMHRIYPDPSGSGGLMHLCVREAADGEEWLRQRVTVLGDGAAKGRELVYNVYWTTGDEDGAINRVFDMFAGFDGDA